MNYIDKVVLVTGGAKGIGKEIVCEFLKVGSIVVFVDKDKKAGEKLEKEFKEKEFKADFYNADLKDAQEILNMFIYVKEKYNKIDVLINNAGISKFKSIDEITIEEWDEIIDVNLRASFIASKEFVKMNKGTNYGRIINIASTRSIMSEPNSEAYAASKGGMISLTHALALSLSNENITVNSISPGWIHNGEYSELKDEDHSQHPSRRVGKPEDIGRFCLFLCEEKNDFINGENIVIDGGMTKKMIYI